MEFLDNQGLVRSVGCSLVEFLQSQAGLAPCLYPTKSMSVYEIDHITDMTYATLQRAAIDIVATQLTDRHGSVLVGVHLNKGEATVSLESSLNNVSKVLEERNQVVLGGVWGEVADINSGLPGRSLLNNHIVALDTMGREVVMTERGCRSHAHRRHGLLLGNRWLALLVGPVAANSARSKPFTVHRAQSLLGILTFAECDEAISPGASSLHVPHDSSLRNRSESRESLQKDFIVDFVG